MDRTPANDRNSATDRTAFRERLRALEADDREGLVGAIRRRVRVLAGRHADIGDRIRASEERGRALRERLASVEAEIVARVDAAVESPVESIGDVESLPADADVEVDASLVEAVERLQAAARENARATTEEGSALRSELSGNAEELERYTAVLAAVEAGELSPGAGRDRLLAWLDGGGGEEGAGVDGRP